MGSHAFANGDSVHPRNKVQRLHESLFALNIGFAITYALFAYANAHRLADAPKIVGDFLQAFAIMLARIASLVVSGRTRSQWLRSVFIREVVFAALVFGIAFLLYLLVRPLARTSVGRLALTPISGIAALIAVPGCWLYIVHATWSIYDPGTFWGNMGTSRWWRSLWPEESSTLFEIRRFGAVVSYSRFITFSGFLLWAI